MMVAHSVDEMVRQMADRLVLQKVDPMVDEMVRSMADHWVLLMVGH